MATSEPGWDLWRTFDAVAAQGTLSGAARTLGLAQPTVGRQVQALEAALGYPLLVRSPRGLMLTEAAEALRPLAATMAATAAALVRAGSGATASGRGVVRLTAARVMAVEVLPPMLTAFRATCPGIEIELSASNKVEDLLTRKADIAVRTADPTQLALIARRIGTSPIQLYAHERYLAERGMPDDLAALAGHTLIGYDREPVLRDFLARLGAGGGSATFAIRTDDEVAQQALLRAGIGIGGMQRALARRMPELRPVLHDRIEIAMPVWLVMHEDLRNARPVRLLFDHLAEALTDYIGG